MIIFWIDTDHEFQDDDTGYCLICGVIWFQHGGSEQ